VEQPWTRENRHEITPSMRAGLITIGALIRAWRADLGLTQRQLEALSGVDQTIISRLERGRLASLRLTRLAALVAVLRPPTSGVDG
jgi:transcriptional regulator with XRE-family HTH domain